jgi:hypothetical protein
LGIEIQAWLNDVSDACALNVGNYQMLLALTEYQYQYQQHHQHQQVAHQSTSEDPMQSRKGSAVLSATSSSHALLVSQQLQLQQYALSHGGGSEYYQYQHHSHLLFDSGSTSNVGPLSIPTRLSNPRPILKCGSLLKLETSTSGSKQQHRRLSQQSQQQQQWKMVYVVLTDVLSYYDSEAAFDTGANARGVTKLDAYCVIKHESGSVVAGANAIVATVAEPSSTGAGQVAGGVPSMPTSTPTSPANSSRSQSSTGAAKTAAVPTSTGAGVGGASGSGSSSQSATAAAVDLTTHQEHVHAQQQQPQQFEFTILQGRSSQSPTFRAMNREEMDSWCQLLCLFPDCV